MQFRRLVMQLMLLAMLLKQRMTLVLPHVRPVVPPSLLPSYLQDVPKAAAANVADGPAENNGFTYTFDTVDAI